MRSGGSSATTKMKRNRATAPAVPTTIEPILRETPMADAKRKTLKQKVEAGQARNRAKTENTTTIFDRAGEAALEAKDQFTAFAKKHPIATVAGGVAIGILIAGLFKGPRQAAMKGG